MTQIPSRDVLKAQAKRLRAQMRTHGTELTHAAALETVAHQWGARDWNTLAARAATSTPQWYPGQRATGRYLGHPFNGVIKAARLASSGFWSLTVRFDNAVDVVTSAHFTSLRQQISTTVNARGESPQKTSDGQPHMVIRPE
ncbi:glyoxalase superfamily protein [Sulfitobacter sp. F26169L]|uniref:glyoxalase superfamily protein n=1 Tax=Sulfitobacter sp. F26169L TaxID=2996015 RepID=UPI002260B281|nr:glyoxalase superfamily protein [Sulfitobacter sp. F26169L]MCX7565063.1 glyoxalase superfamily protein [Sulfitobacter sp. F26169L]